MARKKKARGRRDWGLLNDKYALKPSYSKCFLHFVEKRQIPALRIAMFLKITLFIIDFLKMFLLLYGRQGGGCKSPIRNEYQLIWRS